MSKSKLNLFVDAIVNRLISRHLVNPADAAIYAFGIRSFIIQFLHFLIVVGLSLLADAFWENMLFLFAFLILRVNAGGYHAPTNLLCYLITFITDLVVLMLILYFPAAQYPLITVGTAAIAAVILFKLAPVENEHKLLDTVESVVYYRRTVIITLLKLGIICTAFYFGFTKLTFILTLSLAVTSLFVAVGHYQNQQKRLTSGV